MPGFKDKYDQYLNKFNARLDVFCSSLVTKPEILGDSMRYSLKNGGKRVRPVLMLAVAELIGADYDAVCDYALAEELIHTYSLIHDDLPEMDNDDFRRGKPSCHKAFGAGNAVLAGDGLLNTAYSVLFDCCRKGAEYVEAAKFLCDCAGIRGMIAGQSADLYCENAGVSDKDWLDYIIKNKTARLITAASTIPSVLCGGKYFPELKQFGEDLGRLFQVTDDILDVKGSFEKMGKTIGKDSEENKLTSVNFYGMDESQILADFLYEKCVNILEGIKGDTQFLRQLAYFVRYREG